MNSEAISQFFAENMTQAAAASLQQWGSKSLAFAQRVASNSCRGVAIVTGGGTRVPLEVNTVRYLSNFSSGGRGAGFVESLVKRGWACVYLHHQHSIQPFRRTIDQMSSEELFAELTASTRSPEVLEAIRAYEQYKDQVLYVPFDTVVEYLYLAMLLSRKICNEAECLHSTPMMVITAAAVSDYFIPQSRLSNSKISGDGLTIQFESVPKMLGVIREEIECGNKTSRSPPLYVSFKLETDEETMKKKALRNLRTYGSDLVVANLLQTYKEKVLVYVDGQEDHPIPLYRPEGGTLESTMTDLFIQRIEEKMRASKTE